MTEQPEVTRAIEGVARILHENDQTFLKSWEELPDYAVDLYLKRARQILSLPMVRVVADDQSKIFCPFDNTDEVHAWYRAQEVLKDKGFQRVFEVKDGE